MNALLMAYENRLRAGAEQLEALEQSGRVDLRYERKLRSWLELLAAYEFEYEMAESAAEFLPVAM